VQQDKTTVEVQRERWVDGFELLGCSKEEVVRRIHPCLTLATFLGKLRMGNDTLVVITMTALLVVWQGHLPSFKL